MGSFPGAGNDDRRREIGPLFYPKSRGHLPRSLVSGLFTLSAPGDRGRGHADPCPVLAEADALHLGAPLFNGAKTCCMCGVGHTFVGQRRTNVAPSPGKGEMS